MSNFCCCNPFASPRNRVDSITGDGKKGKIVKIGGKHYLTGFYVILKQIHNFTFTLFGFSHRMVTF